MSIRKITATLLIVVSTATLAKGEENGSVSAEQENPVSAGRLQAEEINHLPLSDQPFMAERRLLASEFSELIESGASRERIDSWREKNAGRHAAVREAAIAWSAQQKPPELPIMEEVHLPPGATEAMKDFLVSRAELHNSRAALLNGLRDATDEERHEALEAWQKQNAVALEARRQLAKRISDEQPVVELEVPDSAHIPPGASPELEAFLTQRHALMKERAEISNQLRSATPEARQQALENWRANNASRLQAMRDAAARLSK